MGLLEDDTLVTNAEISQMIFYANFTLHFLFFLFTHLFIVSWDQKFYNQARCDFMLIANLSNWADCQMANTNPLTLKIKQEIIST